MKKAKCYSCRCDIPDDGSLFCEKCVDDPNRGKGSVGILKIYDKI